ncbi:MAG: CcoQ/FixQ family Cbb3-type cytochrome c oxidase assembly chaperone [Gammaproteobacteria bacterium]|nr:MAG: CcoQ/FixQ family Cbb3-type cytochrome c oxidase assembly chaperone [Gammaproteobacteria bacterium]
MDYGTIRGLFTLLIFALFIVIVIWSYSKKRQSSFDEIANSILDDDLKPAHPNQQSKQETNNNV